LRRVQATAYARRVIQGRAVRTPALAALTVALVAWIIAPGVGGPGSGAGTARQAGETAVGSWVGALLVVGADAPTLTVYAKRGDGPGALGAAAPNVSHPQPSPHADVLSVGTSRSTARGVPAGGLTRRGPP